MHFCHYASLWHQAREMVQYNWSFQEVYNCKTSRRNANNSNATINSDNLVIRDLVEDFEKLENMDEVIATRTVREMTGEVLLQDIPTQSNTCLCG